MFLKNEAAFLKNVDEYNHKRRTIERELYDDYVQMCIDMNRVIEPDVFIDDVPDILYVAMEYVHKIAEAAEAKRITFGEAKDYEGI